MFGTASDLRSFAFDNRRQTVGFLRNLRENRIKFLRVFGNSFVRIFRLCKSAVFPNPPEMNRHQSDQHERQNHYVKQIKSNQGFRADDIRTKQNLALKSADAGSTRWPARRCGT